MGASSCLSKCIIITINLLFWVGAALMITSGAIYLTHGDGVNSDVDPKPAYVAIAIGSLLFLVGLAGICGACSENKALLGLFIVVAVASLALLIYCTVASFTSRDDAIDQTEKYMTDQFNNYGDDSTVSSFLASVSIMAGLSKNGSTTTLTPTTAPATTPTTAPATTPSTAPATTPTTAPATTPTTAPATTPTTAPATTPTTAPATTPTTAPATTPSSTVDSKNFIDNIQSNLHCCGWTNYTDWNSYENWNKTNMDFVPGSCCDEEAANAHNMTCPKKINMKNNKELIYSKGCEDDISMLVKFVFNFISGVAVTFTVLVFFAVFGTIYLIRRKRRSQGFDYSSIVA